MQKCPTPQKVKHKTKQQADRQMWSIWTKRSDKRKDWSTLKSYKCKCGRWHVGHSQALKRASGGV